MGGVARAGGGGLAAKQRKEKRREAPALVAASGLCLSFYTFGRRCDIAAAAWLAV